MARKLRIQYPGAIYHVINRGNYRRDLFLSPSEALAFLTALREVVALMGWRAHAYALMRNHYHLALETPEPNLVEGMHWLQSTWATRFNRFRDERGHLFQGRYQALLVEDAAALARVVDYLHLNPVRAKIVPPELVRSYRWTSLPGILKGDGWTDGGGWRGGERFTDDAAGRRAYERHLIEIGRDEAEWDRRGVAGLSRGWAIGTTGWKRAVAKRLSGRALTPDLTLEQVLDLRQSLWEATLTEALAAIGRRPEDLKTRPMKQPWKLELAVHVRQASGASLAWLARRLQLGSGSNLRCYLSRAKRGPQQRTTA